MDVAAVGVAVATLISDGDGNCDSDGKVDAGAGAGTGGRTNAWKYVLGRNISFIVCPSGSNGLGARGSAVANESRNGAIPKSPSTRSAPKTWNDRGAGRIELED